MPDIRTIKKYTNRRLYDTVASRHVTLDDLRKLIAQGEKIKVVDEKSGEDLTRAVLLQIVSEQEHFGSPVLSIDLLEAIIRFYGNPAQELLTRYLEQSLGGLMQQQRVMQAEMAKALQSPMAPLAELTRQNMELWSKMQSSMLSSFSPPAPESKPKSGPDSTSPPKGKR
ncbi:MAG TPA: polyhydroxyalkanoate synthesis repressor PhaR [Steroidobacteraceae bacterium]|nr:polyhydroxyalkanoate synthesis repressor PhaR [Steroidobacteraceae bacterium]HRX88643.1 polyhydroxyalkanoate synthesis repressor PhaR [Steroidobacteraceae bacterium]